MVQETGQIAEELAELRHSTKEAFDHLYDLTEKMLGRLKSLDQRVAALEEQNKLHHLAEETLHDEQSEAADYNLQRCLCCNEQKVPEEFRMPNVKVWPCCFTCEENYCPRDYKADESDEAYLQRLKRWHRSWYDRTKPKWQQKGRGAGYIG